MDRTVHSNGCCSKRVMIHQAEIPNLDVADVSTPRRMINAAKRRHVVPRQHTAHAHTVETAYNLGTMQQMNLKRIIPSNMHTLTRMMDTQHHEDPNNRRDVNEGPLMPPYTELLSEYRQLAQSLFRRVYYDLSRGIGVPDEGINYMYKSPMNNISTSTYGMYGEIKPTCLTQICAELTRFGLDNLSVVVDLGSGRGAPNFLFAHQVPVFASIGIELCPVSYRSSIINLIEYLKVDVAKLVSEMTGFCTYEEIKAYVLPKAQYVIKEEGNLDPAMVTPTAKLDSVKLELLSGRSNTSKRCTNSDSVNTHYQNYSNHGDETSATPQGSHSSTSSDDDSLYYRVLNEFTKMHSTLAVGFCNEDIAAFDHFEGASHIYSFDAAMEKALVNNIVRQFKNTKGAWLLASFVGNLIEDYDLTGCFLASRIPCQMYKSGERRCCYIYVKNNWEIIKQSHDWMIAEKFGLCHRPEATNVKTQDVVNRIPRNKCTCNGAKKVSLKGSGHIIPTGVDNSTCYAVLSQFYEPVSIMELIKLAKMPLEKQIGWYLAKRHRPDFVLTRSRTTNIIDQKRRALCQQRNKLVELIATATDIKSTSNYVKALQKHIQQNYEPAFTFPFTM